MFKRVLTRKRKVERNSMSKLKSLKEKHEGVVLFNNYSYETALVEINEDNRAVYDYNKMIEWLLNIQGFTYEDAVEWIEYNTIRALPYMGEKAPIIINRMEEEE